VFDLGENQTQWVIVFALAILAFLRMLLLLVSVNRFSILEPHWHFGAPLE
jgi:hypothetical protein